MAMNRTSQFSGFCALIFAVFGFVAWFGAAHDRYFFVPLHMTLSVVCFCWFLLGGGFSALRSAAARRAAGYGAGLFGYGAVFVAMLVLLNVAVMRWPLFRFDSTAEKVYTLAPETTGLLARLDRPVIIRGFFLGGRITDRRAEDLLKRVQRASSNVRVEIIDPEKHPSALEKFGISKAGTLHFSFVDPAVHREVRTTGGVNEQEIANALRLLIRPEVRRVYYLTGHGEPSIADHSEIGYLFFREAVEGENAELKELVLGPGGRVPEDAAAVILAAPKKPYLPEEPAALSAYLEHGGGLLILHEPRTTDDLAKFARTLGIEIGNDVIVSPEPGTGGSSRPEFGVQPVIRDYRPHPITDAFHEAIVLSLASSVRMVPGMDVSSARLGRVTELAQTSKDAWAERNLTLLFGPESRAVLDSDDLRGPVPVAAAYEGAKPDGSTTKPGRAVVIGDADLATNLNIRQLFNRDFLLNCLNWTMGDTQGITIRAKTLHGSTRRFTAAEFNAIFLVTAVLFPELVLLCGLSLWWFRR